MGLVRQLEKITSEFIGGEESLLDKMIRYGVNFNRYITLAIPNIMHTFFLPGNAQSVKKTRSVKREARSLSQEPILILDAYGSHE